MIPSFVADYDSNGLASVEEARKAVVGRDAPGAPDDDDDNVSSYTSRGSVNGKHYFPVKSPYHAHSVPPSTQSAL